MKKLLSVALVAFMSVSAFAQTDANMGIIPAPVSVKRKVEPLNWIKQLY
ncbi:hypothetical protein [Pedobacter steynii]